jgi:hypothetical protein
MGGKEPFIARDDPAETSLCKTDGDKVAKMPWPLYFTAQIPKL